MNMFQQKITIHIPKWLPEVAIIFFIVSLTAIWLLFCFETIYQNKIYPGIWLGQTGLSGKTKEQAKIIINNKINNINQAGIIFYYDKAQTVVLPTITSTESDFAYRIIGFDVETTIDQTYAFGRSSDFFTNLQNKIKAIFYKQPINLIIAINKEEINNLLTENFSQFETPAQNAKLSIDENNDFMVKEEKLGKVINYEKALNRLKINLAQLNSLPIQLFTKTDYPVIFKKDCLNIDAKAKKILSLAPLTLNYNGDQWKVEKNQLTSWLSLKINPESSEENKPRSSDLRRGEIIIGLNKKVVEQFLQDEIASTTDQAPIEAKFEIKDGRVMEFQASQDGFKLNIEASFAKLESELINNKQSRIELVKTELKSKVLTSDINGFGISEIIGIGESDFSGSPKNRRYNIKNGAETLNGILIKPDEEFSLNNALGEINAATGYLPELVIKGNRTIPEYGGGLCQIGTTMFRVAIATGLPITQRRPHTYRVSYYEPAGTDATIYNPWPDMRFINDTGHHILIQSRIEGDNLYFDFWGTKDGRAVEITEPTIYNIIGPGPTKYIETLDLEPGKKRCTESAHSGADTYFDYKVTYANGDASADSAQRIKEKRFSSHYVPWRAVCLIGVEELSEDESEKAENSEQKTDEEDGETDDTAEEIEE